MPDSFVKDPDEVLDYKRDWTKMLESGETILTSTWHPEEVGINVATSSHTDKTATVWLSGGVLKKRYRITNRITTSGGRTFDKTLIFKIREK